ncbi:mitogen-activated protein kinase kinase kinase 17-like [Diospyros lotus]|uniref:mitogen-activated protein kinase kinase kinase 17-like n=1 Tax=Diospyros lotus TaxID=55363 RepID=UPI0022519F3D|nr:mitogen-activated protein kinase kinase kinase 17-like [Diospyros lotus]
MEWTRGPTIGRGSSATVSAAISHGTGEAFAVKSAELSKSGLLQREQRILSSLDSPRVVGYVGFDITEENNRQMYNLFMEYVDGGTLADEIRRHGGRMEEPAVAFYTGQIVKGLEYIHSIGVAHCDIKARNILIGGGGAKIADFGCAKRVSGGVDDLAAAGIGGTPMFMAPEVAVGEEQGCAADIWAVGCSAIEMATGGSPWPVVGDPVSLLYRIGFSGESPEVPDFLSGEGKDFLSKCLRRDPKERWTAKELLKHPFLAESDSIQKQLPDFNSTSPTSVLLDHGVWNSLEEPETQKTRQNSPEKRVEQLASSSPVPDWRWDENWITVRRHN